MCRFIAYLGRPIPVDEVLFQPKNSLVHQSVHAKEIDIPLNGDGFGVGWYNLEISSDPALFTSILPAWNDRNLRYISPKIFTSCLMSHVRRAVEGGLSQFNCHPFHHGRFLFMHNGEVGQFGKIKRALQQCLSDSVFAWIKGQTDSEHLAALFLENFYQMKAHYNVDDFAKVFLASLAQLNKLRAEHGVTKAALINFVVTDGRSLLAVRYTSDEASPASTLYYSAGDSLNVTDGICHLPKTKAENGAVLVVSEKLDSHENEWIAIPQNQMLLVNDDLSLQMQEI